MSAEQLNLAWRHILRSLTTKHSLEVFRGLTQYEFMAIKLPLDANLDFDFDLDVRLLI